jgi:hypothetical protein
MNVVASNSAVIDAIIRRFVAASANQLITP